MTILSIDTTNLAHTVWNEDDAAVVRSGLFGAIMINQAGQSATHFDAA